MHASIRVLSIRYFGGTKSVFAKARLPSGRLRDSSAVGLIRDRRDGTQEGRSARLCDRPDKDKAHIVVEVVKRSPSTKGSRCCAVGGSSNEPSPGSHEQRP